MIRAGRLEEPRSEDWFLRGKGPVTATSPPYRRDYSVGFNNRKRDLDVRSLPRLRAAGARPRPPCAPAGALEAVLEPEDRLAWKRPLT